MNARELLAHFDFSFIKSEPARATILRALALLAAVEESGDEIVRMCNAASYDERLSDGMLYRKAAARIVALEQELASVKAHAEAMAELLDLQLGTQAAGTWEWKRETAPILEAYRAAHPKEGT